jgi:hypothetical protein
MLTDERKRNYKGYYSKGDLFGELTGGRQPSLMNMQSA